MERPECANRIRGEARPALDGGTFELASRSFPWSARERWPRSGPADVELALAAARGAGEGWARLGRAGRVERLLGACAALEGPDAAGALAAGLGLSAAEFAPRQAEELFRFREALELLREGPEAPLAPGGSGPGAFAAHWSDFSCGLGLRLAGRLVAGHTALVWSDPGLPRAAALLVEALEAGGLPPGVVALLHDDLGRSLRWALAQGGLGWARLKASDEALAALGPGLAGASVWPLRNGSEVVLAGQDPAQRAREVARKALGRSGTLSGQLPGQVGRVICHQRLFSRFSEEFLHDLEAAPEALVPAIDGELPEYVRRAWALGLDEGATPIHGGQPLVRGAAAPEGSAPGGAPVGRAPRVVPPVVFTNVEPRQRLARLRRPAPVVVLVRAPSDGAARELAAALDAAAARPSQDTRQQTGLP